MQVESTNGTVRGHRHAEACALKTVSGDVRIDDAGAPERPAGQHGERRLSWPGASRPAALELATVSGDLVLINIACDRAQVRTVNGDDRQYAGRWRRAAATSSTATRATSGSELVGDAGFELAAKTFNGDVHSDLPLTMGQHTDGGDIPGHARSNHDLRGTFGDGSALRDRQDLQRRRGRRRAGAKQRSGKKREEGCTSDGRRRTA